MSGVECKYISDQCSRIDLQPSLICSIGIAVFGLFCKGLKNVWRWRRIQPKSEHRKHFLSQVSFMVNTVFCSMFFLFQVLNLFFYFLWHLEYDEVKYLSLIINLKAIRQEDYYSLP